MQKIIRKKRGIRKQGILKKGISLIVAAGIFLSFTACGKEAEKMKDGSGSQNAAPQDGQQTGEGVGNGASNNSSAGGSSAGGLIQLPFDEFASFHQFGTKEGLYHLTESNEIGKDLYGMYLMYVDYATKQEVYLCSDSGCRHDSESCSAVFSMEEFGSDSMVFVHGDHLYLLSREYDKDGTTAMNMILSADGAEVETESTPTVLYQMGLDGSGRKAVFTFPENMTTEKRVFEDGENLWFVTKKLSAEREGNATYTTAEDKALSQLNLSEKKLVKTVPLEFGDDWKYDIVGASGTKLVLYCTEFAGGLKDKEALKLDDDAWREAYKNSQTVYVTVDIESGKKEELYRVSNDSLTSVNGVVKNGSFYVSDYENNCIWSIHLSSGKKEKLASLSQNYIFGAFEDSICCWSNDGLDKDSTMYFVDMETGEVKHSTLTNRSLGWALDLLADAGDYVLAVYDYDATPTGDGDGSYEVSKYKYGLISKEDLYAGKDSFAPISMVGRGL